MCRNIKTLFNFEPPATELEIRDASLQFVRKLSGLRVPSRANEAAFQRALERTAKLGDQERRLETLCQAAAFYQKHGRRPEAINLYHEALKRVHSVGAKRHLVRVLQGLVALEPESAAQYQAQADEIAAELKRQSLQGRQLALTALGR